MSGEPKRTELKLTHDARLLAGVRGAVENVAGRHGLSAEERAELADTAEKACREAVAQMKERTSCCTVTIDDFEDRIEVRVENGQAQAAREVFVKHSPKKPATS